MVNRLNNQKKKPWHQEAVVKDLHNKMKLAIEEWLDFWAEKNLPPAVTALLHDRNVNGLKYMEQSGYHWEHDSVKILSDTRINMEIKLLRGEDTLINTMDFIINHDGGVKDVYKLCAMVFVGRYDPELDWTV